MVKTSLTGNKKSGYVLKMSNSMDGFLWDVALVEEELIAIRDALIKKLNP